VTIEHHGDDVVVRPPSAVINLREELPRIVSDLSREELRELVRNLRDGYLGKWPIGVSRGEELAKLIEPTAPGLARRVRSLSLTRDDARWLRRALIEAVVAALLTKGADAAVHGLFNHDPPPQIQQSVIDDRDTTNVTNIDTTTVIINPPLPVPPTAPPPAPPG
jgi:hypothetical protein